MATTAIMRRATDTSGTADRLTLRARRSRLIRMLRATTSRQGLLTVAYDVRLDGRPVTGWTVRTWRPERELTIDGSVYVLRARGIARFELQGDEHAVGERSGREWVVTTGGGQYRLTGKGVGRRFRLERDGAEVGTIRRSGALRPGYTAELPEDLPVPVQVFLLWIAIAIWRATTAAAAGASAASGGIAG